MSLRERSRLVMMTRVREKSITIREASEMVGVSYRHCRRIYKRYREEGDRGDGENLVQGPTSNGNSTSVIPEILPKA